MYIMNTMYFIFMFGGMFEKSPLRGNFLVLFSPVFMYIHVHYVHPS